MAIEEVKISNVAPEKTVEIRRSWRHNKAPAKSQNSKALATQKGKGNKTSTKDASTKKCLFLSSRFSKKAPSA